MVTCEKTHTVSCSNTGLTDSTNFAFSQCCFKQWESNTSAIKKKQLCIYLYPTFPPRACVATSNQGHTETAKAWGHEKGRHRRLASPPHVRSHMSAEVTWSVLPGLGVGSAQCLLMSQGLRGNREPPVVGNRSPRPSA